MLPDNVIDYINSQIVGVLAVEMPDGSPHAATLHFAYDKVKNIFLFETSNKYKKSEALNSKQNVRSSFVIGTDISNMKTLQMDGLCGILKIEDEDSWDSIYYEKFPHKIGGSTNPDLVKFIFTPTWWRFTDWTTPQGKQIIGTDYK